MNGRDALRVAGERLPHDTDTPDVETASAGYASRFAGPLGAWLLEVQSRTALSLLHRARGSAALRILEVGGGHGQLLSELQRAGHRVTVHGSRLVCHVAAAAGPPAPRVVADLWELPFRDCAFDAVVAVRLLAHVSRWRELLQEMTRVSAGLVLVDFPPRRGFNALSRRLFGLKHRVEANTRPFFNYSPDEVAGALAARGFSTRSLRGQFSLPMALHRALRLPRLSAAFETGLAAAGLTDRWGGPVLLLAERTRQSGGAAGAATPP